MPQALGPCTPQALGPCMPQALGPCTPCRNGGAWSGKCFLDWDGPGGRVSGVDNIITPGKNMRDWSEGLAGLLAYHAHVTVGRSLCVRRARHRGAQPVGAARTMAWLRVDAFSAKP